MARLRMAVIGVGHLGKEHARILAGLPEVELIGVADVNAEQARSVAARLGTRAYADYWPLLGQIDAACVVVPTTHHYAIARDLLDRGIHLLVEKPLAATLAEAEDLVTRAERCGAVLQVGHIERFNPAFEELQRRPLRPKFITAQRVGPFTGRSTDIGVVLDLMIHDLDLLLALTGAAVRTVEAVGIRLFGQHEDVANARLHFANGCVAEVTASRASPEPQRRMHVWAAEGYASVDYRRRHLTLVQPSPYVREHGLDPRKLDPASAARLKDELFGRYLQTLHLDCDHGDQLTRELEHFVACVRSGTRPRVSGEDAVNALAVADRILASLRSHRWEAQEDGPAGPQTIPLPIGQLFQPLSGGEVAA